MKHFATPEFWAAFDGLPDNIKSAARKQFALLNADPRHPSLKFKKAGRKYWSARVSLGFRSVAVPVDGGFLWFWIGSHGDYDKLLKE